MGPPEVVHNTWAPYLDEDIFAAMSFDWDSGRGYGVSGYHQLHCVVCFSSWHHIPLRMSNLFLPWGSGCSFSPSIWPSKVRNRNRLLKDMLFIVLSIFASRSFVRQIILLNDHIWEFLEHLKRTIHMSAVTGMRWWNGPMRMSITNNSWRNWCCCTSTNWVQYRTSTVDVHHAREERGKFYQTKSAAVTRNNLIIHITSCSQVMNPRICKNFAPGRPPIWINLQHSHDKVNTMQREAVQKPDLITWRVGYKSLWERAKARYFEWISPLHKSQEYSRSCRCGCPGLCPCRTKNIKHCQRPDIRSTTVVCLFFVAFRSSVFWWAPDTLEELAEG